MARYAFAFSPLYYAAYNAPIDGVPVLSPLHTSLDPVTKLRSHFFDANNFDTLHLYEPH